MNSLYAGHDRGPADDGLQDGRPHDGPSGLLVEGPSLRLLVQAEESALTAHLQRLGQQGRFYRFHNAIHDEQIARFCGDLSWAETLVVGWFDGQGVLRGACQVIAGPPGCTVGEFGLSVEREHRCQGLGALLLGRAIEAAPRLGITRLIGHIHGANEPMLLLADRFGFFYNPESEAYEKRLEGSSGPAARRLAA